jgi:hypothetical protein
MSLLGQRYQYQYNDKIYKDSKFKHVAKTVIGLGASATLAYISYKYGYHETAYLMNQAQDIANNAPDNKTVNNLIAGLVVSGIPSIIMGAIFASDTGENGGFNFFHFLRNASLVPAIVSGVILFNEPHAIEIALNSTHAIADFAASCGLAVVSTIGLVSPFFSKSLTDLTEDLLRSIPAFSKLTSKFNDYFEKRREDKLLKQNRNTLLNAKSLEKIDDKSTQASTSVEETMKLEIKKIHDSLINIISYANQKYDIAQNNDSKVNSNVIDKLEAIEFKSQYIVQHYNLETLAYRQEVLSLYGSLLPQIIKSYEASLDNTTYNEKNINTQKLIDGLVKIDEHFGRLENVIREQNKEKKNMDFDEALQFAHTRFDLPENRTTLNEENKLMVMKRSI